MHRVWDVSYDGYTNGKGTSIMDWSADDIETFKSEQQETGNDYDGKDIIAIPMTLPCHQLPSPMPYKVFTPDQAIPQHVTDDLNVEDMNTFTQRFLNKSSLSDKMDFQKTLGVVNQKLNIVSGLYESRSATSAAMANESTLCRMFYQGTVKYKKGAEDWTMVTGCGHHGPDYPGVASVRNGKTLMTTAAPALQMITK